MAPQPILLSPELLIGESSLRRISPSVATR